jgi:hypothetical protein
MMSDLIVMLGTISVAWLVLFSIWIICVRKGW